MKLKAARLTAAERSELESLRRQQESDESAVELDRVHKEELESKRDSVKCEYRMTKKRHKGAAAVAEKASKKAAQVALDLEALQLEHADMSKQRNAKEDELEAVSLELRDAREAQALSKQEQKMVECVETLKRLFPGVKGRLGDLCRPIKQEFGLAITVAAGRSMQSIVVDTEQTGCDCMLVSILELLSSSMISPYS